MMSLSLKPPRGTQDWYPDEYRVRSYIFEQWRKVCQSFGYEEYLGPLVEHADIWRAKSGEDVGGTELTLLTNKDGEISDIALRPEMTPTVTRMVAKKFNELSKPIRWFSIANFYRNERPQRGRNREFRQLNVDIFGVDELAADVELLQLSLEIMLSFNPPKDAFVLYLNNRHVIDTFLLEEVRLSEEKKRDAVRLMDKRDKMDEKSFVEALKELSFTADDIIKIVTFMKVESVESLVKSFPSLEGNEGLEQLAEIVKTLTGLGYRDLIQFKSSLMRGFDYYDGMVFEVFDTHPENNRAMFGGGRYNGLADIFGVAPFPAVGCAPGDEPMRLFLESRGLIDGIREQKSVDTYYLPILDESVEHDALLLAKKLREEGMNVEISIGMKKFGKSLHYADKKGYLGVIIFGEEERKASLYKVKDLRSGEEVTHTI